MWILEKILCILQAIGAYFIYAMTWVINQLLLAIAVFIAWAIGLLPDMPDAVDWGGVPADVFGIVNWLFPVGILVAAIAAMFILWLAWQVVAIALRWGKAV